jgi:hypothetical protein
MESDFEYLINNEAELVYDNYKEPLRKLQYGYYGVVIRTRDGNKLQSHLDGKMYQKITNAHCKKHGVPSLREYKEQFGIGLSTSLMSRNMIDEARRKSTERIKNSPKEAMRLATLSKIHTTGNGERNRKRTGSKLAIEARNKTGTCPDQLLDKYVQLKKKMGKVPSTKDFKMEYDKKYLGTIYHHYGNWQNFVKLAGDTSIKETQKDKFSIENLLGYVRRFYDTYGRSPSKGDFGKGFLPSDTVYYRRWKTMNAIRLQAGVPLIAPNHIRSNQERFNMYMDTELI